MAGLRAISFFGDQWVLGRLSLFFAFAFELPDHQQLFSVPERREADKEGVEDDAAGPDVDLLAVTITLVPFNHSGPAV